VKQVFHGPAGDWIEAVRQTTTGFDDAQQLFASHSAELTGDQAADLRSLQAGHQTDAAHYTIGGCYPCLLRPRPRLHDHPALVQLSPGPRTAPRRVRRLGRAHGGDDARRAPHARACRRV